LPRFSANLSFLYADRPFLQRFAAAAADGFPAVEYLGYYNHAPEEIAALLEEQHLQQALFNLPFGDWAGGERGIGCLPHPATAIRGQSGCRRTAWRCRA
jgi:hydroxypyruvate isomerase